MIGLNERLTTQGERGELMRRFGRQTMSVGYHANHTRHNGCGRDAKMTTIEIIERGAGGTPQNHDENAIHIVLGIGCIELG